MCFQCICYLITLGLQFSWCGFSSYGDKLYSDTSPYGESSRADETF